MHKRKRKPPLEVGTKVVFQCGNLPREVGIISKRMFPGYEFKNTDSQSMRYSVVDLKDKNHSWVIDDINIIDTKAKTAEPKVNLGGIFNVMNKR